jgi:hypothetical protein
LAAFREQGIRVGVNGDVTIAFSGELLLFRRLGQPYISVDSQTIAFFGDDCFLYSNGL